MLSLSTLGGAYLADESGQPLSGAATQRRTIALLALLAASGEGGLSRDKLIGVLWTEAEEERARHSLTQALYAARRALHCEDLFVVTPSSIRLNFERIASDVRAFESALDEGDLEAAVTRYGGPFLDGFYLSGSAEFERWSSAQRERLQAKFVQALDLLAVRAEEADDYALAAEWRRHLAGVLPLDSASVVKLMTTLARAGDRAGALQQARLHAVLLRQELELDPDPVVEALATRLRSGAITWREDASPSALVEQAPIDRTELAAPVEGLSLEAAQETTDEATEGAALQPAALPSLSEWRSGELTRPLPEVSIPLWVRWTVLSLVVLTLLGTGVLIGRARRTPLPVVGELAVRQRVVVAPFRVTGAAPSLAYLRDGMVELLSTRLADDTAARSVDAGAVLGAWRAAGLTPTMDVPSDTVVKLASQLGAERVVVGSVVGTSSRLILRAAVLTVPSGAVSAEATISGSVDDLTSLIDRLAGQLLASEAGEDQGLALQTTRSLPALRAFLAGQAALRAMDYATALRQYDVALRRDSAFALAALQAATAAERLFDWSQLRRSITIAWAHREALNDRDQMLLSAFVGPRFPAPATVSEQRAAWQRIIDLAPTGAELWFTLGSRIYHEGAVAGLSDPSARAAELFERAQAAGVYAPARGMLAAMERIPIDTGTSPATLGPFAPFARWRVASIRGDTVTLDRLRDTMYRLGPANLRAIALSSQYDGIGLDDGMDAINYLGARAVRVAERADVLLGEHAFAVLRGRPHDALAITLRLEHVQPASSTSARRLRVLDALYGDGDTTAAAVDARELANLTGTDRSAALTTAETWSSNLCVLGQWRAARGDSAGVRRAVDALRTQDETTPTSIASAAPRACGELLAAAHAVLTRSRDAHDRVRRLDSLVLSPHVVGDLGAYAPLLLARLHERLGDSGRALAAVRRRTYMAEWPPYLATMLRDEARLAERTGDVDGMRAAYRHYLAYRDSADDAAPELAAVRRRLEAAGEPSRP